MILLIKTMIRTGLALFTKSHKPVGKVLYRIRWTLYQYNFRQRAEGQENDTLMESRNKGGRKNVGKH